MGRLATGTIMPRASVPNEMRSSDVVAGSVMTGDCSRRIGLPHSVRAYRACRGIGACRIWIEAEIESG